MKRLIPLLLLLSFLISACQGATPTPAPLPTATDLPSPQMTIHEAPNPEASAVAFLDAARLEDYENMYSQLSTGTQAAVSQEDMVKAYMNAYAALTYAEMSYEVRSFAILNPLAAQVAYSVTYETNRFGKIERDTLMNLVLEDLSWKVAWTPALIMPELIEGRSLKLEMDPSSRGNIYDKDGNALVVQIKAVDLSVRRDLLPGEEQAYFVSMMADLCGITQERVLARMNVGNLDWKNPICQVSQEQAARFQNDIDFYVRGGSLLVDETVSRSYAPGGVAEHAVGFVHPIPADQAERYKRMGYNPEALVGVDGLEAWGERYLNGQAGLTLRVVDAGGQIVTNIASSPKVVSASITTTIDSELQTRIQNSLADFKAAVVVMEKDTGRIRALVSNPGFDQNDLGTLNGEDQPALNRATQGAYPLGSVFKPIAMAAALETGIYTADSVLNCGHVWEKEGWTGYDWTYWSELPPSGPLTLEQGLMRSCNPWFYQIGWQLWASNYKSDLYDMGRAFGLGQRTGIEIGSFAGRFDQPTDAFGNVQLAIGQYTLQANPVQVVDYLGAIGNDGTLYRPTLVEKITPIDGSADVYSFEPEVRSTLPVSLENLHTIQDAMIMVMRNPSGTAAHVMRGLKGNIAGKTGTAQTGIPGLDEHAWFGGYTFNNNPNLPDIAIAIVFENAGEGADYGAPLFRRIVSLYFSDNRDPGGTMPWEDKPYVPSTETPTPES